MLQRPKRQTTWLAKSMSAGLQALGSAPQSSKTAWLRPGCQKPILRGDDIPGPDPPRSGSTPPRLSGGREWTPGGEATGLPLLPEAIPGFRGSGPEVSLPWWMARPAGNACHFRRDAYGLPDSIFSNEYSA
ncbi:uncharacterized protein LAJ45_00941 [Morchella importuna]|uniref:uncharacterized protein n=1 Tax=Morchella importuna TaxID=1174673 RepID=UPI001E8EE14B|nr:uncharacterized protein LAJ45_00941 [Morchella importuna]KAH8154414.1 hypothetical protein LAJ45_00941 [Morchella importuna]